jgi:uncharacterized damage-inducible protein DinB
MRMIDAVLGELEQEAKTTRRLLERVPAGQWGWKPHVKAMSLGQLALHVASTPGQVAQFTAESPREVPSFGQTPAAGSVEEVLKAHDESLALARTVLGGLDDQAAMAPWRLVRGSQTVMEVPRIGILRALMLNHWYHHRGQLSVYLRQLNVPLPSIYGPSADENPFG